jgi:hypothetical protein
MDAAQKAAIRQGLVDGKKYECFGVSWDATAVECAGGVDYTKGTTPHRRCGYFDVCGQERAADLAARRIIPASSLTRPPAAVMAGPTLAPVRVAPNSPAPMQQYQNLNALAQRAASTMMVPQQQPTPQPMQHVPPMQATHIQYVAQDFRMPQYLTEPEPHQEGESIVVPLLLELGRGALKGLFHTGASFVDRYAFRRRR